MQIIISTKKNLLSVKSRFELVAINWKITLKVLYWRWFFIIPIRRIL